MNRTKITQKLTDALENYLNPTCDTRFYIAKEVTFDYSSSHPVRVDCIQFKPFNNSASGIEKGDFYCYEIKSSVEDFRSKNGHNFIGDYNYYVTTREVFDKISDEIPSDVGVLVISEEQLDECLPPFVRIKNSRRRDRSRSVAEMLLMMFRSANRENIKRNKAIRNKKIAQHYDLKKNK